MKSLNVVDWITLILVIVGGLNWGLVGAFDFNLVDTIFGVGSAVADIVYIVVGLSALYMLYFAFRPGSGGGAAPQGNFNQQQ